MNLKNNIFKLLYVAIILSLAACEEEPGRVVYPYSVPEISNLSLSVEEQIKATDSLFFSLDINAVQTPLSTLEVTLTKGGGLIDSISIRTKGYEANIENYGIYIPFDSNQEDNKEALLSLTAINVEGVEKKETKSLVINRPDIPKNIYLHYGDVVIPMTQQEDNQYEYATESGDYPETFEGKISTSESLEGAKLIWGDSGDANYTALTTYTGVSFSFDYQDWQIEKITFNTFTFKLGVVGFQKNMTVNGVQLDASGGYYQGSAYFTKGSTVGMSGFINLEEAYNRDFFAYDETSKEYTFLRETGYWEVYYSPTYNYMWLARTDDVAPAAFWIVGHGFTATPRWNNDYYYGGWSTSEISRLAYVVKIDENKYQTSIYLNNSHEWGSFEFEIYSNRAWSKENGMSLQEGAISGDSQGFTISQSNGLTNTDEFVAGYYRLTFDTSSGVGKETVYIEKLSK